MSHLALLKHDTQAIKNPPPTFQTVSLERLSEKGKRVPRSWISEGAKPPNKALWVRSRRLTVLAWASLTNFQTVSLGTSVNKGKNKDRALERVSPSRYSVESARSPMHRERRKQWRKRGRHPSAGLPMFLGGCPPPTNPVPCPTAITRRPATLLSTGYSPCRRRCRSWISRRPSPAAAAATLQCSRRN